MLALSIQVAFQQLGVFSTSSTKIPVSNAEAVPFSQVQIVENVTRSTQLGRFVQPTAGILSPIGKPPEGVEEELKKVLAPEMREHVVEIKAGRDGLIVSLQEIGFYESGSASIRSSSRDAIDRLAMVLAERREGLRIEGHTDNVPIHNAQFESNWELSAARAAQFVKLLIQKYGFAPDRLSAAGYAEFHPVSVNDTEEGRARNRRVDIVILHAPSVSAIEPAALK